MPTAALVTVTCAVDRLVRAGLGSVELRSAVAAQLRRAVGFDAWSFTLIDPSNGLPVSSVGKRNATVRQRQRQLFDIKYREHEFAKVLRLAGSGRVSVVSAAGEADRGARRLRREVLCPSGFGDALFAGLADRGTYWGHLSLYRGADRPSFTLAEVDRVHALVAPIGEALRQACICSPGDTTGADLGPGTLLLDADLRVLGATRFAAAWMREQVPDEPSDELPPVVYALAAWLDAFADQEPALPRPRARMRGRGGDWLVVSADRLDGAAAGQIAVTIEPARPAEVVPMLTAAYGLTEREGELVELVLDGLSTAEIAKTLFITRYTVQDHLKAVFNKVGVSSRGELTARLVKPPPR